MSLLAIAPEPEVAAIPTIADGAVFEAAVAMAQRMVRDATGFPCRDDPRSWAGDAPDLDVAIGRILLRAAIEAERAVGFRPPVVLEEHTAAQPAPRCTVRVATWVRNAGLVMLLFVVYQLWGTRFEEHRAQASLAKQFQALPASHSAAPSAPSIEPVADPEPAPVEALPGGVVGRIQIERIGLDKYFVEGTGTGDLRKGPGHYPGSPLPGQPGNAAIAGHRTTYGAPFNRLDELEPGDRIVTTTTQGAATYVVSEKPFPVSPTDVSVVNDHGDDRLTLTTCNPKYSARQRLIVVATLETKPVASAPAGSAGAADAGDGALLPETGGDPEPAAKPVEVRQHGTWNVGSLPVVGGAAAALLALSLLWWPLRRRLSKPMALFVSAPMWVTGLWVLFEALNRMLPPDV